MAAKFLPIPTAKLSILGSTLQKRLPKSAQVWNIFKLFENNRYSEKVSTTFLSFNGDVDDNTLIVSVQHRKVVGGHDVALALSGPTTSDLSECVTSDMVRAFEDALDWNLCNAFCAVDDSLVNHMQLEEMCSRNGTVTSDPDYMYYLPIEDALALNVAEKGTTDVNGITVSPLSKGDAQTVTDYRKFSGPGTLERMEDAIEHTGSAGVYLDGPEGKKLASWVILSQYGSINALFTHPDHRRKGYAKLTMEAVSKWAAQDGLVPTVQIQLENNASKLLMEEVGFLFSHRVSWVSYRPRS